MLSISILILKFLQIQHHSHCVAIVTYSCNALHFITLLQSINLHAFTVYAWPKIDASLTVTKLLNIKFYISINPLNFPLILFHGLAKCVHTAKLIIYIYLTSTQTAQYFNYKIVHIQLHTTSFT